MTKLFIVVGWIEGFSLLALFFGAMPLKYLFQDPTWIRPVGMAHGVLFVAYVTLMVVVGAEQRWPLKKWIAGLVLSSVPFGTWIFEKKFLLANPR